MSQRLPVNKFEQFQNISKFNEDFTENYNEESNEGYFLEVDDHYPAKLLELHNDFPLLPERIKIEKFQQLVTDLHDKREYVIHIRNLKQVLNHGLILGKSSQSD